MEFFDHCIPVITQDGLIFKTASIIKDMGFDWTQEYNEKSATKFSTHAIKVDSVSNEIIYDFGTSTEFIFNKKPEIFFTFRDKKTLRLRPFNVKFIDLDIKFEKLKITYRPKIYPRYNQENFSDFHYLTMNILNDLNLFRGLKINSFISYVTNEPENLCDHITNAVNIKGEVDFSKYENISYNHIDNFICNIYPDRVHDIISNGKDPIDAGIWFRLE